MGWSLLGAGDEEEALGDEELINRRSGCVDLAAVALEQGRIPQDGRHRTVLPEHVELNRGRLVPSARACMNVCDLSVYVCGYECVFVCMWMKTCGCTHTSLPSALGLIGFFLQRRRRGIRRVNRALTSGAISKGKRESSGD